jgi:hypothetical protein
MQAGPGAKIRLTRLSPQIFHWCHDFIPTISEVPQLHAHKRFIVAEVRQEAQPRCSAGSEGWGRGGACVAWGWGDP